MQADCGCIQGTIGPVDKVEVVFDYSFNYDDHYEKPIEGSASISLYELTIDYILTPEAVDKNAGLKSQEQGMLHLKVNDFKFSAEDFPIKVQGEKKEEVQTALLAIFTKLLASDEPLSET